MPQAPALGPPCVEWCLDAYLTTPLPIGISSLALFAPIEPAPQTLFAEYLNPLKADRPQGVTSSRAQSAADSCRSRAARNRPCPSSHQRRRRCHGNANIPLSASRCCRARADSIAPLPDAAFCAPAGSTTRSSPGTGPSPTPTPGPTNASPNATPWDAADAAKSALPTPRVPTAVWSAAPGPAAGSLPDTNTPHPGL